LLPLCFAAFAKFILQNGQAEMRASAPTYVTSSILCRAEDVAKSG
jgi:hypothetical protein